MSENTEPLGDPGQDEIDILDRLIRKSRNESPAEDVSAEALLDYARGHSTPEEARMLRKKLLDSADLRDELVFLAAVSDPETQARFDREKVPSMKWMVWKHRLRERISALRECSFFRRPVLISVTAAAVVAAALFLVLKPAPVVSPWLSASPLVSVQFTRDPDRGHDVPPTEIAVTAEDAARIAFQAAAEWKDGTFTMHNREDSSPAGHPVTVRIHDAGPVFSAAIPEGAEDVTVWFLALPSLHRYEVAAGSTEFSWPDREAKRGLVTITYRSGNEYGATPAREFRR